MNRIPDEEEGLARRTRRSRRMEMGQPVQTPRPQQRLYFLPLPHGHGSFRPGVSDARIGVGPDSKMDQKL
jgi:hypothetical protein